MHTISKIMPCLESRPRDNRRAPVPRHAARRGSVDLPCSKKVHRNRNRTRRARGCCSSSSSGHDSGSSEPDPRSETTDTDTDASRAWIHEGGPDPSSLYGRRHHRLSRLAARAVSGLSLSPSHRDRLSVSRSRSNPLVEAHLGHRFTLIIFADSQRRSFIPEEKPGF